MPRLNRWALALTLVAGCAALWLVASGCSCYQRVDAEAFLRRAQEISEIHSARTTTFIGATDDAAYLTCWDKFASFRPSRRVLWVPLAELPPDLAQQLQAGNPPWKEPPGMP